MKYVFRVLFIGTFLALCACSSGNQSDQSQTDTEESTAQQSTPEPSEEPTQAIEANQEQEESSFLIGIWQSVDDPQTFMELTESEMIWSPGTSDENREPYHLANTCQNASNEFSIELSEPKYISVKKSDLCWFIVNLNENNLELAFAGRGNTLEYRKVASTDVSSGMASSGESPKVAGLFKSYHETGIYGLWSLIVEVDDEDKYFNYDSESPPAEDLVGTYVEVTYEVNAEKREVDVLYKESDSLVSIHGEYSQVKRNDGKIDSTWEKVDGYLVAEQLAGDTPVEYYVENVDGKLIEFEAFVDERYLEINGQYVVVYYRMDENTTATSLIKVPIGDTYDEQVTVINSLVGQIDEKVAANRLEDVKYDYEEGGGFVEYKRSSENNSIQFMTVAYCTGHGCDRTSYYFSEEQLILKLEEKSHWVGNTDEIKEKRCYFDNQEEIFCSERAQTGEGGYDAVLKQMEGYQLTEVKCGEAFDISSIDELMALTEESAEAYFAH